MGDTLAILAGLAKAEQSTGHPGHAPTIAALTLWSLAWEAEARAWSKETGHPVVGHGLACRPDPTGGEG